MSCAFVKFQVGGHRGLVRLSVNFETKNDINEMQVETFVHKN